MKKILEFYTKVLVSLGLVVEDNGLISKKIGGNKMFDIIGCRMESILTKAEYIIDLVEACSEEMNEKEG